MNSKAGQILRTDGGHYFIRAHFEREGYKFPSPGRKRYNSLKWKDQVSTRISIYRKNDRWYFKDFGADQAGDAFTLAALTGGLDITRDFPQILEEVARFYGLSPEHLEEEPPAALRPEPEEPRFPYLVNNDRNRQPSVSYRYEIAGPATAEDYPKPISSATLERYQVARLQWIEYTGSGHRTTATAKDPLFLFSAGSNTKIYRPAQFRDRDGNHTGKQRPATYTGNYCFGYDQLPDTCDYILITAGQNDTLAANDLVNASSVFAVCLWSESAAGFLAPELLADLRSRCKAVFVAYDDDDTGNRTAAEIRDKYGLPVLRIPHRAGVNDLCDLVEAAGPEWTRAAILEEIKRNTTEEERAAAPGSQALTVYDFAGEIHRAVDEHRRLIIQAPTGSGKTYGFLLKQFGIAAQLATRYNKRVIFVLPTNVLTRQAAAEYNVPFVDGSTGAEEIRAARMNDVCAVTYDSFRKVAFDPANEIILIDEIQEMTFAGYRDRGEFQVCKHLFYSSLEAFKVIGLSATPPRHLERAGFHYLRIEAGKQPPVKLHAITYKGTITAAAMEVLSRWDFSQGRVMIRLQSKDAAAALVKRIRPFLPDGMRAAAVNSSNKDTSPDALHIIERRELPPDLAAVFFTSMADTGINLNNPDIGAAVIAIRPDEAPDPDSLQQFIARARRAGILHVFLLMPEREPREAYNAEEDLQGLLKAAESAANTLKLYEGINTTHTGKRQYKQITGALKQNNHLIQNPVSGQWEPDLLNILRDVQAEANRARSSAQIVDYLAAQNPHYTVTGTNTAAGAPDPELMEEIHQTRQARREADAKINAMLIEAPALVMEAIFHATKQTNPTTRQALKEAGRAGDPRHPSAEASALIEAHRDTFKTAGFSGLFRYLHLEASGFSSEALSRIFTALADEYTAGKLERLKRKYERLEASAGKLRKLITEKAELNHRDAARLEALTEKAAKTRARLREAMNRRALKVSRWVAESLEHKTRSARVAERIEEVKRLRAVGPWFPGETFTRWAAGIEAQKLVYLGATEKRRQTLSAAERMEVAQIYSYANRIARGYMSQGRSLTPEKNLEIYRQTCGGYQKEEAAELALKSLFEVEKTGTEYRVMCRTFLKKSATRYGFNIAAILPEKAENEPESGILEGISEKTPFLKNTSSPINRKPIIVKTPFELPFE